MEREIITKNKKTNQKMQMGRNCSKHLEEEKIKFKRCLERMLRYTIVQHTHIICFPFSCTVAEVFCRVLNPCGQPDEKLVMLPFDSK